MWVLQSLDVPGLVVAGLLAVLASAWTLRIARRSLRRLAAMLRTETRAVGEIEPGPVEIEGEVVSAGETVEGRMTGDEGVVTEYRQTRDDPGDAGGGGGPPLPLPQQLVPTAVNRGAVPFYVDDGSGRVLVDAASADVSLSADAKQHSAVRETRTVEARLEPGDDVYVLGTAVPAEEYAPDDADDADGGVLRLLFGFLTGEHRRLPASAVMDDDGTEELVVTRRDGSAFLIADAAEWRGWIRQGLMAALWTTASVLLIAGGGYLVLGGIVGLPAPF